MSGSQGMIKVFYIGGASSSAGTLRAVLHDDRVSELAATQRFTYIGPAFPQYLRDAPATAIIEISAEDACYSWEPGFYRAELAPIEFEGTLRSLRD